MIQNPNHIHTYRRVSLKKPHLYICTDPDCKAPAQNRDLLIGKRAKCPFCREDFILSKQQLQNKEPRCDNCKKSPRNFKLTAPEGVSLIPEIKLSDADLTKLLTNIDKETKDE